jgi:hypothetical protein
MTNDFVYFFLLLYAHLQVHRGQPIIERMASIGSSTHASSLEKFLD